MGIEIKINAGADAATSTVSATGRLWHVITDREIKGFQIEHPALPKAVEKFFGRYPNDLFLHAPTNSNWNQLYETYGWPEVNTVLGVQSATIMGITAEPVIVATKTFTNNSTKKATFDASISDQVSNTIESNWSESNTLEVKQMIKYDCSFLGSGGGGETSISFSHSWGEGGSESKEVTVGSTSEVSVELNPKESIEAVLTANRGVMKVRLVYHAELSGAIALNYNPTYKDHHFHQLNVDSVMRTSGIPNSQTFTEDIEVGYYSSSKIELRDPQGNVKGMFSLADKAAPLRI